MLNDVNPINQHSMTCNLRYNFTYILVFCSLAHNMITSNILSPSGSTQTTTTSHNQFFSFSIANQPSSYYPRPPNPSPNNPFPPYFHYHFLLFIFFFSLSRFLSFIFFCLLYFYSRFRELFRKKTSKKTPQHTQSVSAGHSCSLSH